MLITAWALTAGIAVAVLWLTARSWTMKSKRLSAVSWSIMAMAMLSWMWLELHWYQVAVDSWCEIEALQKRLQQTGLISPDRPSVSAGVCLLDDLLCPSIVHSDPQLYRSSRVPHISDGGGCAGNCNVLSECGERATSVWLAPWPPLFAHTSANRASCAQAVRGESELLYPNNPNPSRLYMTYIV
jgi:hypothetical protein